MTKPLRIALLMLGGRDWMGGAEYVRNIILALASLPEDVRNALDISLLVKTSTDPNFVESVRPYLNKILVLDELVPATRFNRIEWALTRRLLKRPDYRYDVILKNNGFDFVYPCNSSDCGFSPSKVTAWIPDFQHKYLMDFFTKEEIKSREDDFAQIIRLSSSVMLSSRSAEADFKKFYPDFAYKTDVLSFRAASLLRRYKGNPAEIQCKYCLPDKFFIISNQFWRHKNHLIVFKALKLLKEKNVNPVVVCTGHIYDHRHPEYSDVILKTIHTSGLAQQVYLLGLIPKDDQIQLLRRSIALIQPSLFEGWSTVVEEGRCLGKPIILSDIAVHLEQNPPNSRFFDRTEPESLAPIIADYWSGLSPGPDGERESSAKESYKKEVLAFANDFLGFAKCLRGKMN